MSNEHVHPTFQDCLRALTPELEPNREDIREWLEVSMAILTCEDVAKLRRVIHLAEGRIMEIEGQKVPTPRLDDAATTRTTKNEWQEYEARGRRDRDK